MSKVIVITGAGAGLGRTLAGRFTREGEQVILLGRTASKLDEAVAEFGGNAMAVPCDVGSPESVRNAFQKIAERHPRIDVLINNAAVYQPFLIAEATDEQILQSVTTNIAGPVFCTRAAVPLMEAGGHIINVGSESASMNFPFLTMYQTSKAALERFSDSMHHELETSGIRVTLIRAGQMFGEHVSFNIDPEIGMRFHQACMAAGLNLRERPLSNFKSVSDIFRAVIDLPPDVHVRQVAVHARKGAA